MTDGRHSNSTVLIAEDEEALKMLATMTIKARGFRVLAASSAEEALNLWQQHADEIVLLFTDIVMNGPMTGFDVAKQIRAQTAALPVIFSSGHTGALANDIAELQQRVTYLPKPYRQSELGALISAMVTVYPSESNSAAA